MCVFVRLSPGATSRQVAVFAHNTDAGSLLYRREESYYNCTVRAASARVAAIFSFPRSEM